MEERIMKLKEYIKPAIEIVAFEGEMLAASVGVKPGDGLGDDFDEGDESFANKRDYWESKSSFGGSEW